MDYTYRYISPLGGITLASGGDALTGLWFDGQKYFGSTLNPGDPVHTEKRLPIFDCAVRWLEVYFGGGKPDFTPPLELRGTAFRRAVWEILLTVPYGQTVTYGEIAAKLGTAKMSAQAVGGAVGHNPVSLIVPCHRVVGADGGLTGYAAGTHIKKRLLEMERGQR